MANSINGGRLLWWVLGIFAAIAIFSISSLVSHLTKQDLRINALEITLSIIEERVKQAVVVTNAIRVDQDSRLLRFAEIYNKLNLHDDRFNRINDRLLTTERYLSGYMKSTEPWGGAK